jgi:hypothetical protein
MKKLMIVVLFLMIPFLASQAQLKERDNLLGGTLGFWTNHNSPTFGVNYENEVTQAGIGTIGIGGLLRFSSYRNDYYNDHNSNLFIGAQGNYNFNEIGDGKFVPFLGLVLGFYSSTPGNDFESKNSGLWLSGQAGMRYFFSDNVAGVVRFGLGSNNFNALELGVDFKF